MTMNDVLSLPQERTSAHGGDPRGRGLCAEPDSAAGRGGADLESPDSTGKDEQEAVFYSSTPLTTCFVHLKLHNLASNNVAKI